MRAAAFLWCTGIFAAHAALAPAARFPLPPSDIELHRPAQAEKPFTVAGERGALLGQQDGTFELWHWPVKVLSNFRIEAELENYPVPIDLQPLAARIDVNPGRTTITYAHAAFTVKQHMFAARGSAGDAGAVVFFEIAAIRPLRLTFRFTPNMENMWPAPGHGRPGPEWIARDGGYYVLHTDRDDFVGGVALPGAGPGILPPYQERPKTYPLEFVLHFDPRRDAGRFFPLLTAVGSSPDDVARKLDALSANWPALFSGTQDYYAHFFDTRLWAETPDPRFNQALKWAEISIDQARVRLGEETGLVAGYYSSGDSARPGYAWFFGRDTLWTLYAVNSYGDFALSRDALEFLIHRQRADGKIMHEYSQAAPMVDWKKTPYFYASADSTPLFVMTMFDYLQTSGDTAFLRRHWDAVKKAYEFTRAHDSDGDGIYDNSEGTGWVEAWPPKMPHQEIYLAALDQQSSAAVGAMAAMLGDAALASRAKETARHIGETIEREYWLPRDNFYAFSHNADGSADATATIYPAVAWWSGTFALKNPNAMLARWASHEFDTDWGTRDLSVNDPKFDPISYHQGSVWPLFTGWVALAEYRAGQPLAGLQILRQNAMLTFAQDIGSVTELLSGVFYEPLGRSSSHQTWSSAMVLTPALRGMFGLRWDAPDGPLAKAQLPAEWDHVVLHNVPGPHGRRDITLTHEPADVELGVPEDPPSPGAQTAQLKYLGRRVSAASVDYAFEGLGGREYRVPVRVNRAGAKVTGGRLEGRWLYVRFPAGPGYQKTTVRFSW